MKKIQLSIFFVFAVALTINAQAVRNAAEAKDNRQDMVGGAAMLDRDLEELESFKATVTQFENAWERKDLADVTRLKAQIENDMLREINQSQRKLRGDNQEVLESRSELRSESREVRYDRRDRRTIDGDVGDGRDLRADRRDRRDDRGDLKDDASDYMDQTQLLDRQKEIYNSLKAFNFSFTTNTMEAAAAQRVMIREFIGTMETDIRFTRQELGEDKGEIYEDRSERRDDKRERRERRY